MHTSDQKLRDEAIAIMQKNNAFEYVKRKADAMVEESWREVDKLLKPSEGKEKLKAFAEFLIKEKHLTSRAKMLCYERTGNLGNLFEKSPC